MIYVPPKRRCRAGEEPFCQIARINGASHERKKTTYNLTIIRPGDVVTIGLTNMSGTFILISCTEMFTTSEALIDRIRITGDRDAWCRFVDLYLPLIYKWNLKAGLQPADSSDVSQEIIIWISEHLHEFERLQTGSFRSWLKTIAYNKLRSYRKQRKFIGLDDLGIDELVEDDFNAELWGADHDRAVFQRAVNLIRPEFRPSTFNIFTAVYCDGQSADKVAEQFGVTKANVYVAQSRVISRFKVILKGFVQEDD